MEVGICGRTLEINISLVCGSHIIIERIHLDL